MTALGSIDVERVVAHRYATAAREREPALCCPVDYDARYLEAIPPEVLERDYGCGDPSRYVRAGDRVLDLGSGGGKICFIASQIVGAQGQVLGVDANPEMLALARGAAGRVAEKIGYANVAFRRGQIQDLGLDLERLDAWLAVHPVKSSDDLAALEAEAARLRREDPLVADTSVDLVVSNCVLNLVREEARSQLVHEIFRVLRPGGRIAIADIVSDEPVPEDLKRDPELWSGCVAGAFEERTLLRQLEQAGFYGIQIDRWEAQAFAVVRGIEFRSLTVTARRGKEGPCLEAREAVVYRGPWRQVEDDDGHVLRRGERTAVCAKTHRLLTAPPYADQVVSIPPREPVSEERQQPFDCSRSSRRDPRETKGADYTVSTPISGTCCGPEGC